MMQTSSGDHTVKLLVIEASPNRSEKYVNALRNAGIAAHPIRVETEEEILEALEGNDPDMVLCACEGTAVSLSQALSLFEQRPDIPLIVLYQERNQKALLQAMRSGARDIVARDDLEHMQLVVKREFEHLLQARRLSKTEQKLKESEDRCTALMQSSRDAIAYVHDGMHVRANPAYLEMFGYFDMDDIEGTPLLDMVTSAFHGKLKKLLRSVDSKSLAEPVTLEVKCQKSDGSDFDAALNFSPGSIDGEPCTQVMITNQKYKKELEQKLAQLTSLDIQTGLHNRQYFMQAMDPDNPTGAPNPANHTLFYITLDNIDEIRNSSGITACDKLVKEVAGTLKELVKEGDVLARFGEYVFTLLTPINAKPDLTKLAEGICSAVETHVVKAGNQVLNPTCSIGIASFPEKEKLEPQKFMNYAFRASEAASSRGGNQFAFFEDAVTSTNVGSEREELLEKVIRNAVEKDRFRLVYQPIVSLQGDLRENYSVMVRMLSEDKQDVLPGDFLLQAEKSGYMAMIDRWVIEHAIEELVQQRKAGKDIQFFISISGASIQDEGMLLWIYKCLDEHQAMGGWITFQLSEVDVRSRIQEVKTLVEGLKQAGCRLCVEHFGMLPKSETLLKHLPADFVRLDHACMDGIAKSEPKQQQLKSLHDLITSHNAKTVATGVEDANTLAILWNMGINYIQGYFLQEPSEIIAYDFTHS
jgi:diguanylate cyclase (GGDEF)-like protein/PAS domain S-box-containing protein